MSEFDDLTRLLREERPQLSELELDQIKRRARTRAAAPRKGQSMRSRLAILGMLVAGMLVTGTGGALAVTGLATQDDASVAQYGTPTPTPTATPSPTPTPTPQATATPTPTPTV